MCSEEKTPAWLSIVQVSLSGVAARRVLLSPGDPLTSSITAVLGWTELSDQEISFSSTEGRRPGPVLGM